VLCVRVARRPPRSAGCIPPYATEDLPLAALSGTELSPATSAPPRAEPRRRPPVNTASRRQVTRPTPARAQHEKGISHDTPAYLRGRVIAFIGALSAACLGAAFAESAPTLFNFQGRLTNAAGAPVTAATAIRITLLQGGTPDREPLDRNSRVSGRHDRHSDSNGVFAHVIGSGNPVSGQTLTRIGLQHQQSSPYSSKLCNRWERTVPRTRILSAGFAIEASRLDGKSSAEIIGQTGGNVWVNETFLMAPALVCRACRKSL